ncbi:MAG TPA: DUF4405 domain-containing protein [Chitinophagaceae bacterium]|nr:DUF4405 domain-containing protein [Chitinophagaceae bacterium]
MQNKKYFTRRKLVLILDIVLFLSFMLCLSPRLTGLPLHEIVGVFIIIPAVTHVIVEWKWLANYIKRFIARAKARDRVNLVLNVALFIAIIFQVFSGLVISKVLAPFMGWRSYNQALSWRYWHNQGSTITMFLTGFHLALSWKQVRSYFIKKFRPAASNKRINIRYRSVLRSLAILLALSGIISAIAFMLIGPPVNTYRYHFDDISRFMPTFGHGFLQLFGETFFVLTTAFVAIRWLKVRL